MKYSVVFTPEAEEQLAELYNYIAESASPDIAARYTDGIISYCESLNTLPHRGNTREDIRPGLRVLGYRRRIAIAFEVSGTQVAIIGVFYGGQDHETILSEEGEDHSD